MFVLFDEGGEVKMMNSENKLFLPDKVLYETSSFFDYVNELKNRLYGDHSIECLIEKAEDEHRAFRLLPLLLIKDENLWKQQLNIESKIQSPLMHRAIVAVSVYLNSDNIGHVLFKESLIRQTDHVLKSLSIYTKIDQQAINDAKNLWKDLATYRYTQWKRVVGKNNETE